MRACIYLFFIETLFFGTAYSAEPEKLLDNEAALRALLESEPATDEKNPTAMSTESTPTTTDQRTIKIVEQMPKDRRIALVVGNSNYLYTQPLRNPQSDALAISESLALLGFDVEVITDASKEAMADAVQRFSEKISDVEAAMFYYAGHGVEHEGKNFLVPIDANIQTEDDITTQFMEMSGVLRQMEKNARVSLIFLDACRDFPMMRKIVTSSRALSMGLAPIAAADGTLISYATKHGQQASDGNGDHSPYTSALLPLLEEPGVELGSMMRRLREQVRLSTNAKQTPWEYGSIIGEFYFNPLIDGKPLWGSTAGVLPEDKQWERIRNSKLPSDFESYLRKFPSGQFVLEAKSKLMQVLALVEDTVWATVSNSTNKDDLSNYLQRYPNGRYRDDAQRRFDELMQLAEGAVWGSIRSSSNPQDFENYLKQYPHGRYAKQAQLSMGALNLAAEQNLWSILQRSRSSAEFKSYLDRYPNGKYARQATQLFDEYTLIEDKVHWSGIENSKKIADFETYLQRYPSGRFVKDAKQSISDILIEQEDNAWDAIYKSRKIADFESYLARYPKGRYGSKAKDRIATLKEREAQGDDHNTKDAVVSW